MSGYYTPYPPARRPPVGHRRGWWVRFVHRYGWRAYALPILSAVTVAALLQTGSSSTAGRSASADGPASATGARQQHSTSSTTGARTVPHSRTSAGVKVEGRTAREANFAAGLTPAPVVVNLGNDVASCATNTYRQLVLVSISQQHLWACQRGKQVNSTAVTTGATVDHDQTPLGSWRVQAKQRDRYLVGPGYRDYVHYWVPFDGDFGLHDAPWQTMPFGSKDYSQRGSHGCVHVPTTTMAWLYRWSGVGDTVVTIEA